MRRTGPDTKRFPDDVIVEEPLEVRLDGHLVATTMRTPGHDFELAVGFCHAEGLLARNTVRSIRYCGPLGGSSARSGQQIRPDSALATNFNVVSVETDRPAVDPPAARLGLTTSACGVCGADAIDALCDRLAPLVPSPLPSAAVANAVDEEVRRAQALFGKTGAVHGAACFDTGTGAVKVVREDIGRHNAVDKVVGRLLLDGSLPAAGRGLFVSGRASFEMVQKGWAAGFSCVLAVGGPSSLAVETARAANLGLAAFVRGDSCTIYAPERPA